MLRQRTISGSLLFSVALFALGLSPAPASAISLRQREMVARCAVAKLLTPDISIETATVEEGSTAVARCHIEGHIVTLGDGAPSGSAGFVLDLPFKWNGKLLFDGGGGLNGYLPKPTPEHLMQGYAALGTDGGHRSPDPLYHSEWMRLSSGAANEAAIADYLYRAIPQVTRAARPLIASFYGTAPKRSYFVGCSNGGRESLFQAQRSPELFDGFIAGSPSTVPALGMPEVWKLKALRDAPIPFSKLSAIGAAIRGKCDAADGVKDGLIQNPAACDFNPSTLVTNGLLSGAQAHALTTYLSAIYDENGKFIEPGSALTGIDEIVSYPGIPGSVTGLAAYEIDPEKGDSRSIGATEPLPSPIQQIAVDGLIAALIFNDPSLDVFGPSLFSNDGKLLSHAVEMTARRWKPGLAVTSGFSETFRKNRKILIYHGLNDHDTTPYETQMFFLEAAALNGGLEKTSTHMRLFLAPGMEHCGGGPGPNTFDAVSALDKWVEGENPPRRLDAMKFTDDDPHKALMRSMPLCPFPAQAQYDGKGPVNDAKNWHCPLDDKTLLMVGRDGQMAGLSNGLP